MHRVVLAQPPQGLVRVGEEGGRDEERVERFPVEDARHGGQRPPVTSRMLPVQYGRLVAEEPHHRIGNLGRLAGAADREQRQHLLDPVGLAGAGVDLRVDHPGPHHVHAHALGGHLLREPEPQRVDGSLRGGVIDVLVRAAEPGGCRGDEHDRATPPVVPGR